MTYYPEWRWYPWPYPDTEIMRKTGCTVSAHCFTWTGNSSNAPCPPEQACSCGAFHWRDYSKWLMPAAQPGGAAADVTKGTNNETH